MKTKLDLAMWEIKSSLNKILLIETFLETCLIFLVIYLLVSVLGFLTKENVMITTGVAIAFFLSKSFLNILQDKIKIVGKEYPDLQEELQTARDYPETTNEVVTDLHEDTVRHASRIQESAFVNPRSVVIKVMAILLICLAIILSAPMNLRELPIVKDTVKNLGNTKLTLSLQTPEEVTASGPEDSGSVKVEGEIFGETRTVEEGVKKAKFEVPTSNFEVNLKEEETDEGENFNFDSVFPTEIGAPDPELFSENIPKEQQELVKNYFKNSAEG